MPRGDIHFLHTQKKNTEQSKISLSRNSPATLDAPFVRFAPAALNSLRLPGGGPIFDCDSEGGYQNFTVIPRGGMRFLRALFPKRTPPPPTLMRNSEQSLSQEHPVPWKVLIQPALGKQISPGEDDLNYKLSDGNVCDQNFVIPDTFVVTS